MVDFNTSKVDGNTVAAVEWNQLTDIDNFVTTSGQTSSTSDLNQLGIGAARYSSGGQFYTDSGTANAYVLSPVSPFKAPVDATNGYFNGMTIRFRAGNANTGASTVNVNSAGVKNLKKEDGTTDLAAGDILTTRDVEFRYNGTSFVLVQNALSATTSTQGISLLPQQITIANNSTDTNHDLDFGTGNAQADDGSLVFRVSALTKRIDATWAAGTNQGGLDTGTVANNTPYYCFAIYNPTTLASDILISASKSSPTLPSGFTKKCYIGACHTNGSANIRQGTWEFGINQYSFQYQNNQIPTDVNITSVTTANRTLYTLSCPVNSEVILSIYTFTAVAGAGTKTIFITNNSETDSNTSPTIRWSQGTQENISYSYFLLKQLGTTNQIGIRGDVADPDVTVYTQGWKEYL